MGKKNKRDSSGGHGSGGKNRSSQTSPGWAKQPAKGAESGASTRRSQEKGKRKKSKHDIERLPPVYRTAAGRSIDSPLVTLGFPEGSSPTKEAVRKRTAELLSEMPAEQDPGRAEQILEARRWLTQGDAAMERLMGRIELPDPEACLDGYLRGGAGGKSEDPGPTGGWTSQSRLAALMVIYSLVEYELDGAGAAEASAAPGEVKEVPKGKKGGGESQGFLFES